MTTTFKIENGDVQYRVSGTVKTISDGDKVRQDVKEMLLINQIEGFGASLVDLIAKVDNPVLIQGAISRQITGAVNGLIRLQRGLQRSQRPISELIDSIQLLQISQDREEPTTFTFQLALRTVQEQTIILNGQVFPTVLSAGSL